MVAPGRAPHPALAAYIGSYVGYHHVLDPRAVHHGLPAPAATVVISFDQPLDAGWLGEPETQAPYWMLASGLHTSAALIRTHGLQHGIQLPLTPLGVRALLGLPIGALGATMTTHDNLPLGLEPATYDAIASADLMGGRFDVLEGHLLGVAAGHREDPAHRVRPELAEAWRLLTRSRGRLPIAEVASRVGWKPTAPRRAVRHRVRRRAEAGRPADPLLPRPCAVAHGTVPGRHGVRRGLCRPGASDPRMARARGPDTARRLSRNCSRLFKTTPMHHWHRRGHEQDNSLPQPDLCRRRTRR